jgi:cytidine deaminase
MKESKFEFTYEVYDDINELKHEDADLLKRARTVSAHAYAPYSSFFVGAVAKTINGDIVTGTNQENASFPVGICAERSLLASAAALFPGAAIDTMAISYENKTQGGTSDKPISPCGMCRQALQEYEVRGNRPMRLILGGQSGRVFIVKAASQLLPFAFTPDELI